MRSVTLFENNIQDVEKILGGAIDAMTFKVTKEVTIGGLTLHAGDVFEKEIAIGKGEEKISLEELKDLRMAMDMKLFPVKLMFKVSGGGSIDWNGWDKLSGGSTTLSVTLLKSSIRQDLTMLIGALSQDFKVTTSIKIGGLALLPGDTLQLQGSLAGITSREAILTRLEGLAMSKGSVSISFVRGGSLTTQSTVLVTVSKQDLLTLMKFLNFKFVITREITIGGVLLRVGDRLDLSGSLSWVKSVEDLLRVKGGTTLTFIQLSGGSVTTVVTGGSTSRTTTKIVEQALKETSGQLTSITSGGGGGVTTEINIAQSGCCSKFPGLRVEIDALRLLVDKEAAWVRQELVVPGPPGLPGDTCRAGRDVAGAPGLPGEDGPDGLPGPPGKDGMPGNAGADGMPGLPGLRGIPGVPGLDGLRGPPGTRGADGTPGLAGMQGAIGFPGKPGSPGTPGTPGKPGKPGVPGEDAPEGDHSEVRQTIKMTRLGLKELKAQIKKLKQEHAEKENEPPNWTKKQVIEMIKLQFAQLKQEQKMEMVKDFRFRKEEVLVDIGNCECEGGEVGSPGPKGLHGSTGLPGMAGATGGKGAPGKDGAHGAPGGVGLRGPVGAPGEPGLAGDPGKPGAYGQPGEEGRPGRKGPDGSRGRQGTSGPTGATGTPGPPGFPGLEGKPGTVGASGTPGIAGSDGAVGSPGGRGLPGAHQANAGAPGPAGPPGLSGRSGRDGNRGPPGPPGQVAADGLPGPMGMPGVAGADGKNAEMGMPGMPGPSGRDGSPGKAGKDGPPGGEGEPGPPGGDGNPGLPGASEPGPPGPEGAPGPPGADGESEEIGELQGANDKSKQQMQRIIALLQEVSVSQQTLEQRIETTRVIQEDSSKEYLGLIEELKTDALEEAEHVAKAHCEATAGAKNHNSCCEDCTKSPWRVPSKASCREAGCSHGCGYELTTCDEDGKLMDPCHFPFEHGGKSHDVCITDSPFGPTKHPWCKTRKGDIALCDCPVIKCSCPAGSTLDAGGRTCSGVSLAEYAPLGLAQLPAPAEAPRGRGAEASLLQQMSSLLR